MKIKTTNDVLSLNKTNKPVAITGMGRCGTTFMSRQIYRQAVINDPTKPIGFLDEFFRIRNGIYEFYWDELPRIKNYNDKDAWAGYFFRKSYGFPGSTDAYDKGEEADLALEIIAERVNKLKEYDLNNLHMKAFPMDLVTGYIADKKCGMNILESYNWIFLYREDWLKAYVSFVWGALHDKFHFYNDEELEDTSTWVHGGMKVKQVWANPYLAKMTIDQSYGEIYHLFTDEVDFNILEMKDISEIENNEEEFYNLVNGDYEFKKYIPDPYWMRNPKRFENKNEFVEAHIKHVDKLKVKAVKRMREVCADSKGLLNLSEDGTKLYIDESKKKKGKPLFRPEMFGASFTQV